LKPAAAVDVRRMRKEQLDRHAREPLVARAPYLAPPALVL
jgi:hypothetical protein